MFSYAIQMTYITDALINDDLSYSTMNSVTPSILGKFPKIIINKKKMSCIMEMEIHCFSAKVEFAAGKLNVEIKNQTRYIFCGSWNYSYSSSLREFAERAYPRRGVFGMR